MASAAQAPGSGVPLGSVSGAGCAASTGQEAAGSLWGDEELQAIIERMVRRELAEAEKRIVEGVTRYVRSREGDRGGVALARMAQEMVGLREQGVKLAGSVEKVGRDIKAVARRDYEQCKEIENLHRLAADGVLNFVRSVEPRDFCCFAFIMAYGDRAKAARELEMPERKFYERVDSWATRGAVYKRMFDLVRCRKNAMLKGTVALGAALQSGGVADEGENPETVGAVLDQIRAGNLDQRNYPQVLQEIFNALGDMNAKNWPAVQREVMGIIREEVPQ